MLYSQPMTTIEQLNARGQGYLPGLIGIEFISIEAGRLTSRLALRPAWDDDNLHRSVRPSRSLRWLYLFQGCCFSC
jgi:hypothetical protein